MPAMRIRIPFAIAFAVYCLAIAYIGFSKPLLALNQHSDKGLHFVAFFILTIIFYWILDTSRRRVTHFTLIVCTAGLSIGSEIVQGFLPNDRIFDPYDILANVLGSTSALLLCSWYHKRMLERRRANKHYDIVPGEEGAGEVDVELGEGIGGQQESGVIAPAAQQKTVTEELDTWDENAEDWDEAEGEASTDTKTEPKRVD